MNRSSNQLLECIGNVKRELERLVNEAPGGLTDPVVVAMSAKLDRLVVEWYRRSRGQAPSHPLDEKHRDQNPPDSA